MGSVKVDVGEITNSCFVVMPFDSLFESQYRKVIAPAVKDVGLDCIRGDEIYAQQSIVQDIWRSMRSCRVVVAELSERNPNVMYEIGLAHAIGKPIVLLTREQDDVPFDLRSLRYIFYDTNDPGWGENLRNSLREMLRKALEDPGLAGHLGGIEVSVELPEPPVVGDAATPDTEFFRNYAGAWTGRWISITAEREHVATLTIPDVDGLTTTCTMTVTFLRRGQQTIVLETLLGSLEGDELILQGASYSYVERGNSEKYSLDSFKLRLSEQNSVLEGVATLRHGKRDVRFQRGRQYST